MVGENGEAYRIAFEKHPSEKPEVSAFAKADPKVQELARRAVWSPLDFFSALR